MLLYALELRSDGGFRVHYPAGCGVTVTAAEFAAADGGFSASYDSAWQRSRGTPDPYTHLAIGWTEALRALFAWTDETLSAQVSALLMECGKDPDVLLCASGWAQSLPLDLLTVENRPLIHYANTLRWIPGFALQERLIDAAAGVQKQARWDREMGTAAFLPILEKDEEGGYCRQKECPDRSFGPDYLAYRCSQGDAEGVITGGKVRADTVRNMARGFCRSLLILAHGCPERGGVILWDQLLTHLGTDVHIQSLLLVSCDMGRFEQKFGAAPASQHLLSGILESGRIRDIAAFRHSVPDLPAIHFTLELCKGSRGQPVASCDLDLASSRTHLLRRYFPDLQPARKACDPFNAEPEEVVLRLHRFVAAVSVVYSGMLPEEESVHGR